MTTHARTKGFTLVELLIVIVVIAVLAAITLVSYNGVQNRANDTTVKADISNLRKKLEMYKLDNGNYPQAANEFPDFKITRNAYYQKSDRNNVYYVINNVTDEYALGLISKSGADFIVTRNKIRTDKHVDWEATAQEVGVNWSSPDFYYRQGWYKSDQEWSSSWNWVND